MDTRIIPRYRPSKSIAFSPIAQTVRLALMSNGSSFFFDQVRHLPQRLQAWVLNDLAERVIALAREIPERTPYRWWVILDHLRAQAYRIDDADLFMLQARLGKAGY